MSQQDFAARLERLNLSSGPEAPVLHRQRSPKQRGPRYLKTKIFLVLLVGLAGWIYYATSVPPNLADLKRNPSIAVPLASAQRMEIPKMDATIDIPSDWRPMTHLELLEVDNEYAMTDQNELQDLAGFMAGANVHEADFMLTFARDPAPVIPAIDMVTFLEGVFEKLGVVSAILGTNLEIVRSTQSVDHNGHSGGHFVIWAREGNDEHYVQMRQIDSFGGQVFVMMVWKPGIVDVAEIDAILDTIRFQ